MVWKIFSLLSALLLGGAAYYAFISKEDLKVEKAALERSKKDLAEAQQRQADGETRLKEKTDKAVALAGDLTKAKDEVVKAAAEEQEKIAAVEVAKTNEEQIGKQLAEVKKRIEEAGDIEKLLAQVKALKADQTAAETDLANQTQALTAVTEKLASTTAETERLRVVEANARRGVMEANFSARIAQAFGEWGFAVLNKGNAGGVVANADLEVKRGSEVVAKLKVRNVEQNISVADIVPDSLAEGEAIRSGDIVTVVPVAEKPATPPQAPAGTQPAAPTAPANPADPFAAPAGGMAPAAPAAADPFGAAPAAPAAAPMTADPFGAPAPAGAAPAAGAGTKDSPSTADPFAK